MALTNYWGSGSPPLAGEFLAGNLSAAAFALYPLLAGQRRLALREPAYSVVDESGPRLRAWMHRIEAQPFFDRTYPPHWR
jgi:glutathione S-transferase